MAGKPSFWDRLAALLRRGRAKPNDFGTRLDDSPSAEMPLGVEWATYQAHKPELLACEGQWVVIRGQQILGIRPTYEEALRLGYERAGYADFLVHQILAAEPVYPLPPQPT